MPQKDIMAMTILPHLFRNLSHLTCMLLMLLVALVHESGKR